jgi:hypothetical protein
MRHLTNDERSIRRSAGISILRFVPFLLAILALMSMSFDNQLFQECIGTTIVGSSRYAGWARLVVSIGCSPYYVRDFSHHWLVIGTFVVGVVLAIPQLFWMKRHKVYWDSVREKERLRRADGAVRGETEK